MSLKSVLCNIFIFMMVAACAGNEKVADPVQIRQPGDEDRSCNVLVAEMNGISEAISRRDEEAAVTPGNLLSGNAGPGIDIKNFRFTNKAKATEQEIDALQKRYEYLDLVARRKLCYQ